MWYLDEEPVDVFASTVSAVVLDKWTLTEISSSPWAAVDSILYCTCVNVFVISDTDVPSVTVLVPLVTLPLKLSCVTVQFEPTNSITAMLTFAAPVGSPR